ncbi:hypothetical protein QNZ53_003469 [Vibrio parahaemolyticus]|nr:hypothetical protein [Vibrio parahaemolyticus]
MSCICTEVEHNAFDDVMRNELKTPIYVDEIVNQSRCFSIDLDVDDEFLDLTLDSNEILSDFNSKMGVYHLWVQEDTCGDHFDVRMLCAYVGKGYVQQRIKSHIKTKWNKSEKLYVSFYECSNRLAKYIEQLFLNTYKFHLNTEENTGSLYLKTIWDDGRFSNGTETQAQSEKLAVKNPEVYNP